MFKRSLDIVAIGDTTTDAFIRLKEASVHCKVNTSDCEICMPFGDKIPFEYVKVVKAVANWRVAAHANPSLIVTCLVRDKFFWHSCIIP